MSRWIDEMATRDLELAEGSLEGALERGGMWGYEKEWVEGRLREIGEELDWRARVTTEWRLEEEIMQQSDCEAKKEFDKR